MSEYQVMRWHQIPSMVIAREGETIIKVMLAARFQEAIDEAAMQMGETDADAYTSGWNRDPWLQSELVPEQLASSIAEELEQDLDEEKLISLIKSMGEK
jgi:hypothetical protein